MTLTSFVSALYGYRNGLEAAETLFDQQIAETVNLISELYSVQDSNLAGRAGGIKDLPSSGQWVYQIWLDPQNLVLSSATASRLPIAPFREGFHDENFAGHRWRILVKQGRDRNLGQDYWVMAAERADLRYLLADRVAIQTVIAVIVGLPVAALLIWLVVGQALKLLRQLAGELRDKQVGDLSPLGISKPPKELVGVVAAINSLLERLELSLARERRLTADAAHELRTPISSLKVHLHNLADRLPADDQVLLHLRGEAERLEHLVEQILMLYRVTPEHYQANMEEVDLTGITRQAIADRYGDFADKQQQITLEGESQLVTGDLFALSVLVQNLLTNANKYTPQGGSVTAKITAQDEQLTLAVIDSGPGIPEPERQRVFERFYRIGGDRHASATVGSGLGLSIVKLIAELHGATLSFSAIATPPGFAVEVIFPKPGRREGRSKLLASK